MTDGRTYLTDFLITDELRRDSYIPWRRLARDRIRRDLSGPPDVIRCIPSRVHPRTLRVVAFRGPAAGRFGRSLRHYRKMLQEAGL